MGMDENIKISVIVPVYKVEEYLDRCIQSLVSQTYSDLEIILIDDGSPDNCGEICDNWAQKDKRIVVIHKQNGGVSAARNTGLKVARGEYIGFVDSDDYLETDMYEQLIQSMMNAQCEMAVCSNFVVNKNGSVCKGTFEQEGIVDRQIAVETLSRAMNNSVWNKLFKREALKGVFFDEDHTFGEDHLFLLMALKNCHKVSFVNKPLYYYVQRENSTTGAAFSKKAFDQVYIKDAMYSFVKTQFPYIASFYRKLCFSAREQLCRKIILANEEKNYRQELYEYMEYLKEEFPSVKKELSKKECMEYRLLCINKKVYCFVITIFLKMKG